MEKWYDIVRKLQDESENKYLTRVFCEEVFHDLYNGRIKEKQKFKNRMGPEFEHWLAGLFEKYSEGMVRETISDDEFWDQTLSVTQTI